MLVVLRFDLPNELSPAGLEKVPDSSCELDAKTDRLIRPMHAIGEKLAMWLFTRIWPLQGPLSALDH